jgi:hypothetical protein
MAGAGMTNRQTAEQRQAEGIATILRERNVYRDALLILLRVEPHELAEEARHLIAADRRVLVPWLTEERRALLGGGRGHLPLAEIQRILDEAQA